MNRSRIEWTQYTWNPVTGCLHGCEYCYAREIATRFGTWHSGDDLCIAEPGETFPAAFAPTFYPHRLTEPARLKTPSHIFAVSMGDLFGDWVPDEWIGKVLDAMSAAPQHSYTVLTKAPQNLKRYELPSAVVCYGTSITGALDADEIERLCAIDACAPTLGTLVSLEPYLHELKPADFERYFAHHIDWLIIGGQTGRKPFAPPAEWISPLVEWARERGTPVFVKDNCRYPETVREWPDGVPH